MEKWEKGFFVGLDIGGTKIEGALLKIQASAPSSVAPPALPFSLLGKHYSLEVLRRMRVSTERDKGYKHVLDKIIQLLYKLAEDTGVPLQKVASLGIGLPGAVDPQTQRMLNGNTALFIDKDLVGDLQAVLGRGLPIRIENDAKCFVLAEVYCGVGQKYFLEKGVPIEKQIGLGIILGTGCGGGIVAEGKVWRGRNGGAMEVGHTQLIPNGKLCYCGRYGCAEGVLSGTGLEESYQRLGKKAETSQEIFRLAQDGDFYAQRIVQTYQQYLVQFLLNLANVFDPDYFVLGGGVAKESKIYEGLEERVKREIFLEKASPKVFQFSLGDSAGVIGAACLPLLPSSILT